MGNAFCVLSKKSSPIFRLRIYSMFSSQSFIPLAFRFRFMAHPPEITFCFWCEVGAEDHFFSPYGYPFLALLVVKTFFSLLNCFGTLDEKCGVYSWTLFCSLIYLYILIPTLHCFDYYNFMVSYESGSKYKYIFAVNFQDSLGYSRSWAFPHKL